MSSGWLEERRFRFDGAHHSGPQLGRSRVGSSTHGSDAQRLLSAVDRTREYLLNLQHSEGYWVGELEGDTILESEYILLLAFLGRGQSDIAQRCAKYILTQQQPGGGWGLFPGAPLEISASVKAYLALKITGHDPSADYMLRAREAIRAAGGAERVNSFTRYYLALLGLLSYNQVPAVPPEIILLPEWMPFNIYEMSAWSRTIIIPLSLLWAFRPSCQLPAEHQIRELFLKTPEELPVCMPRSEVVDGLTKKRWINWHGVFSVIDRGLKFLEWSRLLPLRKKAIARCAAWMQERFENSDGLGAIFPPIIWSIIGLKCLGHTEDSPDVQRALNELEKLSIHEGETTRLEPCKSPVWDTAIATIALREAGVPSDDPAIQQSVNWLLSKEVRHLGDWAARRKGAEPGGWFFEFENRFYPDVDDTCMVVMALARSLPTDTDGTWRVEMVAGDPAAAHTGGGLGLVLTSHDGMKPESMQELQAIQPVLQAMGRGARWIAGMQNRDGGWGAFDRDNDRELFTQVPFADHNAMIDPSTADLTGRMLEMYAGLGMSKTHPIAEKALNFVWSEQESDHCWFGRWGVNYLYGTWQVLVGLAAIGVRTDDPRVKKAVAWLKTTQQSCGGWGETPLSYDEPALRGQGAPTASQTAWALMGLIAGGEAECAAVDAGIQYLLNTQLDNGTWDEEPFTGTGFPKVFYLKYHLYRTYFPLMALARLARVRHGDWVLKYEVDFG